MDESGGTTVYSLALWTRAKDKEIGEKLQGEARKAEVFCRSFSYIQETSAPCDAFGENGRFRFMKISQSCALLLDCISAASCRTLVNLAKNFRGALQGRSGTYFAYYANAGTVQLQTVTGVGRYAEFPVWKESSRISSPIASAVWRKLQLATCVLLSDVRVPGDDH